MLNPIVSIVIPLYNKERFIIETLKTVEQQSFSEWECIIVDDGSTDQSKKLVSDFIAKSKSSFRLVSKSNTGQSAARNTGIKLSKGKYVAFLDGDDLWLPDKLKLQVKALESNREAEIVLGGYAILEEARLPRIVIHRNFVKLCNGWLNFRGFGGALESIALIRTDSLRTLDFNEELSTSAGLDLFYRLGNKDNVLLLPDILMGYLKYPGQWHRGFKTLEKDALKMASLMDPVTASKVLEGIRNYEALINLKSLVKNGSKWGSFHNLRRTIRVSFFFFVVAYFSRQIKAFLLALKYRVELRILRTHTHQFLNTTV